MHELGIVFHIISSLEQVGAQNHLRSISTVTLEILSLIHISEPTRH